MPSPEELVRRVSQDLLRRSGALLYSGGSAWTGQRDVYVLGTNPGGGEAEGSPGPDGDEPHGVRQQVADILSKSAPYSEYRDGDWADTATGMPLAFAVADTPASNLIFVRSRRENGLGSRREFVRLAEACWPFHEAVIGSLGVRAVICFGGVAGGFVGNKLKVATQAVDSFREGNRRSWSSEAHRSPDGRLVFTLTHPSLADWTTESASPLSMVRDVLTREGIL